MVNAGRTRLAAGPAAAIGIAVILIAAILTAGILTSCTPNGAPLLETAGAQSTVSPVGREYESGGGDPDFEVVRQAAATYLHGEKVLRMGADELWSRMSNGDETDDPFILSLQAPQRYAAGHIPGALNAKLTEIAQLDQLAWLPNNRLIVVYCDNGHLGQLASTLLDLLGYDAINLDYGLLGWTADEDAIADDGPDLLPARAGYPLETEANIPAGQHPLPVLATGGLSDAEVIRLAADRWLRTSPEATILTASAVYHAIAGAGSGAGSGAGPGAGPGAGSDGSNAAQPLLVDVRTPEQYAQGHLPGAISLPWQEMVELTNLAGLPTDRPIIAYSEYGQTGAAASAVLGILGYRASSMAYGIAGWTNKDALLREPLPNLESPGRGYPLEQGQFPAAPSPAASPVPEHTPEPPAGGTPVEPTTIPLEYESKC